MKVNRTVLCILLALGYLGFRLQPVAVIPVVPAAVVPFPDVEKASRSLSLAERAALSETYMIISRSIAADPADDRVFVDLAAVRRAHRAALLAVYKGVLDGATGKAPDLREALEQSVNRRLGDGDVPLNPTLQQQAAATFSDLSASLR